MRRRTKVSRRDRATLRNLAGRVAEIAALPEQAEKVRLWTACNDLRPERAMVFAWQFPPEFYSQWMSPQCEDEALHPFERALREKVVRHERVHDDFPILDTFNVEIQATGGGYDDYGFQLLTTSSEYNRGAYHIEPVIKTEADIGKLHFRPIEPQIEGANRSCELANELFGDLLKVRRVGRLFWRYGLSRVLIHMRGLDRMMMDMYEQPEIIHRLMAFLRDDFMRELDLYEGAGEVAVNNLPDNICGSGGLAPTESLPGETIEGAPGARHCFCWGESQETVGVGPQLFDEFVLQYQQPLLRRFGLVDYGCCEPLDHKFDVLFEKVPNLRWCAVPPSANRERAAEKIGKKYVFVYKPNPSRICTPRPDWASAESDIRETIAIARGCAVHVIMKDIHTLCGEPERVTQWTDVASRVVREMA